MKNNWWNFLNDAGINWTETVHWIMLATPLVGLILIFMFRRPLSRIDKRVKRIILGTLGGLILTLELTQDITKIIANAQTESVGAAVKHQVLEMMELCRLNTLLLGAFLLANKINWIKWIAGTTLFGGWSTIYDHYKIGHTAEIWGIIKHGVVLTLVPAFAIAKQSEKFTLKNLGYAHVFNYVYVSIVILLNYLVPMPNGTDRSIANLNEAQLADNAMVGWVPNGGRIVMYVLFVTAIFWIWWGTENFIHRHTNYDRKINYRVVLNPKNIKVTSAHAAEVTRQWFTKSFTNIKNKIKNTINRIGVFMKKIWNKFTEWTKATSIRFGQWFTKTAKATPAWTLSVIKGTPSWIKRNSAILFTIFLSTLFLTLVGVGINASLNGNYDGTTTPWQGMDPANPGKTLDPTWAKLPGGYVATFVLSLVAGALSIAALGGWLRGSAWINKSNTYVKGTVYVRTKAQNVVFRIMSIMIALVLLTSFFLAVFYEDLNEMMSKKSAFVTNANFSSSSVLQSGLDYILTPSHWYYQCFLSSVFMGFALVIKKYKWVQYLLPLAFIGAFRTFIDVTDWADDASWTNIHFLRLTFVHIMIVAGPIFIMVSNRYRYSLKDMKISAIYTFIMALGAYLIFMVKHQSDVIYNVSYPLQHAEGIYDKGYGELTGVGDILHMSEDWIKNHSHIFFWFVVCPFGLLIFLVFVGFYNFFYFKAQAKGNFFKRWITMWKPWYRDVVGIQWIEFKQSLHFFNRADKPAKVRKTLFGIAPAKGKVSEDPYANIASK